MCLGSLLMSFEWIIDFIKKTPSLVSLIASIVFVDSIGGELYLVDLLIKYEKWSEY